MQTQLKRSVNIAVIAPEEPVEFFDLLWEGIWSATFELSPFGVNVQSFRTRGHTLEEQLALLNSLKHRDYHAIALVPAHGTGLNAVIAEHVAGGTPVVTFNADAPESRRCAYVGADARRAGELAGEVLAKLVGHEGKIVSFPGLLEMHDKSERYRGFRRELERWGPSLKEISCHEGDIDLREAAYELLQRHPSVNGIYVGCSRVFQVAQAMKDLGLRIPCVGFNNTSAVRPLLHSGHVSAVVDESTYQQGYIALQRAYEAAVEKFQPVGQWVTIPTSVVYASNCQEATIGESLNQAFELLIRQRTTKLRSSQQQLEFANLELLRLAETDPLTGLLNRRKFEQVLDEKVTNRDGRPVSLLMLDLDCFKACNDSYGHHVGDEALRVVGRMIEQASRATDFCARLGGDEFCLLLPGATRKDAAELRDRVLQSISNSTIAPQTLNLRVRASAGAATIPDDGTTAEDLIVAADQAMYSEKRRNREPVRTRNVELTTLC